MSKWKYLVGWCPNCGKVSVVTVGEGEEVCGCGHDLLYKTLCRDAEEVSDAVRRIEGKTEGAFESRPLCSVSFEEEVEDAKKAAQALADGDDPFDAMCGLLCMLFDGDCAACPMCDDGDDEDSLEFAVIPSPYRIWARGETYGEAVADMREHIGEYALAGFTAAMKGGDLSFTVIPVDGDADASFFKAEKRKDA